MANLKREADLKTIDEMMEELA